MTNYAIRPLCRKRDKPLRMGFCRKAPPIEDVFASYKLEKKKKKRRTSSPSPLHHRPPKLRKKPLHPRSQGYLLPALRSERDREPGNEVEAAEDVPVFHSSLLTREVIKTNFKAMKKKVPFFLPLHSLVRTKIKTEYKSVGFFKQFIVNVTTRRLRCLWSLKHLLQITE